MLMTVLITLAACSPAPSPSPQPSLGVAAITPVPSAAAGGGPVIGPMMFSFDVENRASVGVVVSVASDTAATMPGFGPGQRGTISIRLLNPQNGISVEIQGSECRLLASALYPTPSPFTLFVDDEPGGGGVELSTRDGALGASIPLPSNSLVGCGG